MRAGKNILKITSVFLSLALSGCAAEEKAAPVSAAISADASLTETTSALQTEQGTVSDGISEEKERSEETVDLSDEAAEETPLPQVSEENKQRFSERLREIYSDYAVTGMSVALFRGGEIIHTENLGYADVGNKLPCCDNTRYRVASVSKTVSAMMLMQLCEKGMLTLDEPLSEAVGIEYDAAGCSEKVTLAHLLTHTAGLFDPWDYLYNIKARLSVNDVLKTAHSGYEPGTVYNYSNFGAGTIGAVVEAVTGEYFHDYARDSFFEPLGMDAGYVIDLIDDKESAANIYDYDGQIYKVKSWGRTSAFYESFGLGNSYYSAQGELIITASDLARLGIVLAGDGTVDGKRVLSESSVKEMNTLRFEAPEFGMGLNVRIYDNIIDGRVIYGHPGNALGAVTGLYYDPADHTGVAVLTNGCLPSKDEFGFYAMIKEVLTEAYECYFSYEN